MFIPHAFSVNYSMSTLNERLAAIRLSVERTHARCAERCIVFANQNDSMPISSPPPASVPIPSPQPALGNIEREHSMLDIAEATLRGSGFVHLQQIIDDDALIDELDAHISEIEHVAYCQSISGDLSSEHVSGCLLPPALEPERRSDVLLALDAPVTTAMFTALVSGGVQPLLTRCLGPDALLWELSAMRVRPGAKPQPIHPDTKWQQEEPSALVVWIAMRDVTLDMGPTLLLPGTHTKPAHEAFHAAQGGSLPPDFAAAAAVGCEGPEVPLLKRGDALLMDSRLLHCGLGNRSDRERTLFYFTFRRNGDADSEFRQSSLRQSLRDRYELDHLCNALWDVCGREVKL